MVSAREICKKLEELRSRGAGLEKLLQETVDLLHNSNPSFHWTGIYEPFPAKSERS